MKNSTSIRKIYDCPSEKKPKSFVSLKCFNTRRIVAYNAITLPFQHKKIPRKLMT